MDTIPAPRHTMATGRPIPTLRSALIGDYLEAKSVATESRGDTDQHAAMMFAGQSYGAARALAQYLAAVGEYPTLDAASSAIAEGRVEGLPQPAEPAYGPDGFLPIGATV